MFDYSHHTIDQTPNAIHCSKVHCTYYKKNTQSSRQNSNHKIVKQVKIKELVAEKKSSQ